jgi:hypothetical protein
VPFWLCTPIVEFLPAVFNGVTAYRSESGENVRAQAFRFGQTRGATSRAFRFYLSTTTKIERVSGIGTKSFAHLGVLDEAIPELKRVLGPRLTLARPEPGATFMSKASGRAFRR